eukprot:163710_1
MSRVFARLTQQLKPRHLTLIAAGSVLNNSTNKIENNQDDLKRSEIMSKDEDKQSSSITMTAIGAPLTFGLAMGACAGYASKKATKVAAGLIGVSFIGLQLLQHGGYITVDWMKIEKDVEKALDQDGDGKFDRKDIEILRKKYMGILQQSLLTGGGFAAGFYAGIKYG